MDKELREKHIEFIYDDTKKRGEEVIDDIYFVAALYHVKIKKDGKEEEIEYSAAATVLPGYRKIMI